MPAMILLNIGPSDAAAAAAKCVGLLRSGGIKVTASVLEMLRLQPPGRAMAEARDSEHLETIKSLSDGHITIDPNLEVRAAFFPPSQENGFEPEPTASSRRLSTMQASGSRPPVVLTKSLARIGGSSGRTLRAAPQAAALRRCAG